MNSTELNELFGDVRLMKAHKILKQKIDKLNYLIQHSSSHEIISECLHTLSNISRLFQSNNEKQSSEEKIAQCEQATKELKIFLKGYGMY